MRHNRSSGKRKRSVGRVDQWKEIFGRNASKPQRLLTLCTHHTKRHAEGVSSLHTYWTTARNVKNNIFLDTPPQAISA